MSMDVKNKVALAVGVGAAILTAAAAYKAYVKSSQKQERKSKQLVKGWNPVGKVTALHVFPIKSCHGVEVVEAQAEAMGLVNGELQDRFVYLNECNFV